MIGKVVVVTGAAGGIGRSTVHALVKARAVVWALDLDKGALDRLVEEAAKQGGEVRALAVDVTDARALGEAAEVVCSQDKRIHGWINNAGISGLGGFDSLSPAQFQRVVDVNFFGTVHGTRVAMAHMEGGGAISNIGSIAGFVPAPYLAAYSASKHAVVGFTRALREELRLKGQGVRMVLVSPGFVDTALLEQNKAFTFPAWLRWALCSPDLVARAIVDSLFEGAEEVAPSWNGRVMQGLHTLFPAATRRRADMLLARSFRDWVLNRYTVG